MTTKKTTLVALLLAGSTLSPLPLLAQDAAGSQKMIPPSTQSEQKGSQDNASTKGAITTDNSAQMQQSATADAKADAQLKSRPGPADAGAKADAQIKPQDNQSAGAAAAGADKNRSADQAQSEQMKKSGDSNTAAQTDQKLKADNDTASTQKPINHNSAQSTKRGGSQDQQSAQGTQSGTTDADRSTTAQSNTTDQTNINNTNSASADRPSNEITGSINISTEQKTEIRNVIVENKVETVKPTFSVSVGVSVPKTVKLHRLPPKVVEIVPQYKSYEYFVLADNRIVIVEPSTYEIVYILVV